MSNGRFKPKAVLEAERLAEEKEAQEEAEMIIKFVDRVNKENAER
jgi:hypothetical protein